MAGAVADAHIAMRARGAGWMREGSGRGTWKYRLFVHGAGMIGTEFGLHA